MTAERRKKIAIISTFDELCGIASYTRNLEDLLSAHVDIEIFDLDQYYLRSQSSRVQKMGDRHIKDIAGRLREFDVVNIQLEYGTLGSSPRRIMKRLKILLKASPALSVTFHTIPDDKGVDWQEFFAQLFKGRLFKAISKLRYSYRDLARGFYKCLRRAQSRKPVSAIALNRRDMRLLRDVWRLKNVSHHPLSFVSPEKAASIRSEYHREMFPTIKTLPAATKLIGAFGFLSPYKGFETAIRALYYLPEDYHLLIFGGVHPQSIKREISIDPYIKTMLSEADPYIKTLLLEANTAVKQTLPEKLGTLVDKINMNTHGKDLSGRIHFMGTQKESDFAGAMSICDMIVFPYVEVEQAASGPLSMAIEMGCRVIASKCQAFRQIARYHPDTIEFFDIGNFIELAQHIAAHPPHGPLNRKLRYNVDSSIATYLKSFQMHPQDEITPSSPDNRRNPRQYHQKESFSPQ